MRKKNKREKQDKIESEALQELQNFIASNPDSRELKRALVTLMLIEGLERAKIKKLLRVSSSFISKCKALYALQGIEGLKLKYRGSSGELKLEERQEVLEWLTQKNSGNLAELENYIEKKYQVIYKAKKSYYTLFKEAGISWKKTQKKNPKRNEELVKSKQEEICQILENNREEIETGKLVVYLIDECHLLWGDVCGYSWGKTSERIEIPITNERERQTYYGGINYLSQKFIVEEYQTANAENTVKFLKYLQSKNPEKRHIIIWDGASYHKYKEMKDYLKELNQGLEKEKWLLTCILLAPNAPEQNPVEDIWLIAKTWLRKYWYRLNSFSLVKWFFNWIIHEEKYEFPKLHKYGLFQPKRGSSFPA